LYINVFTPNVGSNGKGREQKLPVLFWSYGGGDTEGESNDYDGSKLALQGNTVVVTFNYRLNVFGFLSHPALDHEGHLFANYGILDNQFALHWVRDNIAAFGGDPNNVTVFGQSAGSTNSSAEVLSPLAKGLFQRAIFESGAMPALTPLSIAESKGTAFAVAAGCGSGSTPTVAKCLRGLSAAQVQALAQGAYEAGTTADGQILPTVAIKAYETGDFNHVPIMIGNVENEGIFFIAGTEFSESPQAPLTEAQEQAYVTTTYGGNAGPGGAPPAYPAGTIAAVNAQYPLGSAYPTPELQWAATETDGAGPNASICKSRHIDHILANQVPLYTYEFRDQTAPDYWPPMPGFVTLAYHTGDIQYYWPGFHGGPLGISQPLNPRQQRLSDELVAAWTNFAWTGNPNGRGNSPWPQFTNKNSLYLAEDTNGLSTETDAQISAEHQCSFWDKIIVYAPAP
jgi:para-nitrobenzyl esterase